MDWIEVADSAVKIGLGAVIGGVISVLTLHLTHRNDRNKDLRTHHIKTIESITENVDKFFNAHMRLISKIAWYVELGEGTPIPVTADLEAALRKPDLELLEASDLQRAALSRLKLLGAIPCVVPLKAAGSLIMDFRNRCAYTLTLPSSTEIQEHLSQLEVIKSTWYEQLRVTYRAC